MVRRKLNLSLDPRLDERVHELMRLTRTESKAEFFNDAAEAYDWIISEIAAGRTIASVDENTRELRALEMPPLRYVKRNRTT